ncbi:MAG: LysE family translocator [Bacteroidota bacterium]
MIWSFIGASTLLTLAPGPDNLFVLVQSATRGSSYGLRIVIGLCIGILLHTSVVCLGIGSLIANSSIALHIMKYTGAGYLLYLAWMAGTSTNGISLGKVEESKRFPSAIWIGIVMNALNPKVLLFFMAFLPQFVDSQTTTYRLDLFILGMIFMLQAAIIMGGIALASASLKPIMLHPRFHQVSQVVQITVFVGLALYIILP